MRWVDLDAFDIATFASRAPPRTKMQHLTKLQRRRLSSSLLPNPRSLVPSSTKHTPHSLAQRRPGWHG